ncbi:hypothetical protein AVEN_41563-1 [Araneus ventricosus]|uniref:Uncharacterized protein n=1 Tax=Araneus ventricosus TaxID=182803 RepID=A0A4Y2NGR9_ARAVE|nr:hypothetical protein AVEN_41563-1 [Araneus ventricosus]
MTWSKIRFPTSRGIQPLHLDCRAINVDTCGRGWGSLASEEIGAGGGPSFECGEGGDKTKIKEVRKIRNQGLAVDCEDDCDVQNILSSIQNQEELKKNITHVQPKGKLPKVIFYNIPNDIKEPEMAEGIRLRLSVTDETIKVKFKIKGRKEAPPTG